MIRAIEEYIVIIGGYSSSPLNIIQNERYQLLGQINNIAQYLQERNLQITNMNYSILQITQNRTIIDYVREFIGDNKQWKEQMNRINKV